MEQRIIKAYAEILLKDLRETGTENFKLNNMATKKSFTGGLNSILGENPKQVKTKKVGRPVTQLKKVLKSSEQGTKENETRATFIVGIELLDKIKAIAYWDRVQLKDVINNALEDYAKKSKVKPRPEEERKKEQENNQRLIRTENNIARLPKY